MALEGFGVVSAAVGQHGILVHLGAAKSATRRGKPMAIDRLITFNHNKANFAWYSTYFSSRICVFVPIGRETCCGI